jgi:hypothetical protein
MRETNDKPADSMLIYDPVRILQKSYIFVRVFCALKIKSKITKVQEEIWNR